MRVAVARESSAVQWLLHVVKQGIVLTGSNQANMADVVKTVPKGCQCVCCLTAMARLQNLK